MGKNVPGAGSIKNLWALLLITLNSVSAAMMWSACGKQMEKIDHNIVDIHHHDKNRHIKIAVSGYLCLISDSYQI